MTYTTIQVLHMNGTTGKVQPGADRVASGRRSAGGRRWPTGGHPAERSQLPAAQDPFRKNQIDGIFSFYIIFII